MIKMFVMKYVGGSYSLFDRCESYIGRITKKGNLYAFNKKGYWTQVIQREHAHNRLANYFEIEKTFYVNNYKESLNYPLEVDSLNWGVDIKKILSGAKFTFKMHYSNVDVEYTGKVILDDGKATDIITQWISPFTDEKMTSSFSNTNIMSSASQLVKNVIEGGLWIIKSIEDN